MEISDSNTARIIKKVTLVGIWINAFLVLIKLLCGYWGHSDALVADGYHSASDFITDFIVLVFVSLAYKKADNDHPYGHGKYETIASVIIGLILLFVAIYICAEGIGQIIQYVDGKTLAKPKFITIIVALLSIIAKEFCYRYTHRYARKVGSSVLEANAWHHRSDAYSSISTVIAISISFFFGEHWRILDPVGAIIISVFIAISAIKIAAPSINELLEVALPKSERENIVALMKTVSGVKRVHNMRSRRNGRSIIIDVNVHVDPDITVRAAHEIATGIEVKLKEKVSPNIIIYVHIEPEL